MPLPAAVAVDRALAQRDLVAPYRANVTSFASVVADWRTFREQITAIDAALAYPTAPGAADVLKRALTVLAGEDVARLAFALTHVGLAVEK